MLVSVCIIYPYAIAHIQIYNTKGLNTVNSYFTPIGKYFPWCNTFILVLFNATFSLEWLYEVFLWHALFGMLSQLDCLKPYFWYL